MRSLLLLVLLVPSLALAQESQGDKSPGSGARPPAATGSASEGGLTSAYGEAQLPPQAEPAAHAGAGEEAEQRRLFTTLDFWRLAPGSRRAEVVFQVVDRPWVTEEHLEARVILGLTSHLHLSVAEVAGRTGSASPSLESTPIALRYTPGLALGEVPGNPALEVEWQPRHRAPSRAAARLLLGGEVAGLLTVVNLQVAQNVERSTLLGVDGDIGAGAGASYPVLRDRLRVGGEARVAMVQNGRFGYEPRIEAGPTTVVLLGPVTFIASLLLNLSRPDVGLEPMAAVGCPF